MKKVFALLSAPLMLAALLTSCQPEQSELNLESLPGTATITGKVEYNPGVTKVGDALVSNYTLPAAGRTVCVKVYTDAYVNPSEEAMSGNYRTFTAQTDSNGLYSISVPVGYQTIRPEVTVLPFMGEKNVTDVNNQIVTLENALFETNPKHPALEDQTIAKCDFVMTSNKEPDVEYNQKVTLSGLVQAASESRRDDHLEKVFSNYPCELLVIVSINGTETMKYTINANSNGRYNLDMMLPNTCWDKEVLVSVIKEASVDEFTHYYYQNEKWNAQTIDVIYAGQTSMRLNSSHKVVPMAMKPMEITPQPVNLDEVKGIGNDMDAENEIAQNDPMEWGW